MLLAAAAKAATETHWWDDWLKFTPGWLAFLWVILNAAWKGFWVRRHHLALGVDADGLRDLVKELRSGFEVVTAGSLWEWDQTWRLRVPEVAREVREQAERPKDKALKAALMKAADSMDRVIAAEPDELGPWAEFGEEPVTPEQQAEVAANDAQRAAQKEAARAGTEHVASALARLTKLERRTHGRS